MKNKLKLYRVYLDRPGAGWEEFVQATNVKAAIKNACKKQGYDYHICAPTGVVGEKVPDDYLVKKATFDALKKERDEKIDKIAKDYIHGVEALVNEYKIKIDKL